MPINQVAHLSHLGAFLYSYNEKMTVTRQNPLHKLPQWEVWVKCYHWVSSTLFAGIQQQSAVMTNYSWRRKSVIQISQPSALGQQNFWWLSRGETQQLVPLRFPSQHLLTIQITPTNISSTQSLSHRDWLWHSSRMQGCLLKDTLYTECSCTKPEVGQSSGTGRSINITNGKW